MPTPEQKRYAAKLNAVLRRYVGQEAEAREEKEQAARNEKLKGMLGQPQPLEEIQHLGG